MSLEILTDFAKNYNVLDLSNVVLQDDRFSYWSGSSHPNTHHYGKGGLLQHTTEVVELSLRNNGYFIGKKPPGGMVVSPRLLFLAALFHDAGKMWDYEPMPVCDQRMERQEVEPEEFKHWRSNLHKREIYHISRSSRVWTDNAPKYLKEDEVDQVWHAILAHHGQREWGSPVAPHTAMAWILHLSDSISARVDDFYRIENHHGPR